MKKTQLINTVSLSYYNISDLLEKLLVTWTEIRKGVVCVVCGWICNIGLVVIEIQYTKPVSIHFHMFWLATQAQDILWYPLFAKQNGCVSNHLPRWVLTDKIIFVVAAIHWFGTIVWYMYMYILKQLLKENCTQKTISK